jgi:2,4-dienoyl-CoA reductase-like NADH-dependent reductase (Old Yellow Enzyme family)
MSVPALFDPITFRSVTARNRITVSPMCQYSATDGVANDWHIQHLGARAMGGAGIVFTEVAHVSDIGRITPYCLGLYSPEQLAPLKRIAEIVTMGGAVPAMQIGHAGRKAGTDAPWRGGKPIPGVWEPVGPTATPFGPGYATPHALSTGEIAEIIAQFVAGARVALEAGFKIIELHGAHGYLLHSFLSPVSNTRNDEYGGDLAGRARFLLEVVDAVRDVWPEELPLFVRLSCVDWMEGGLTIADTVEIAKMLKATGKVDLIDCSSGNIAAVGPVIPRAYPGYQVPFAEAVRHGAKIPTGAVGMISEPTHADEILANGRADLVFVARAILADPVWPLRAAKALGAEQAVMPQYARARL